MIEIALAIALIPCPAPELHVVCVHEPRVKVNGMRIDVKVQVVVSRPRKDVTLVLSAYNPCTWDLIVAPNTNLKKVILAGYHKQAAEVPKGVEVVELFYESKRRPENAPYLYAYYDLDSDRLRPSVQQIHRFTGLEILSYQGSYNYDATAPIVVDRVRHDDRLDSGFPRLTPAGQLPKLSFQATRLMPGDFRDGLLGTFTNAGPEKKTLKALPDKILQVAYDPGAKVYYGITGHELHTVEPEGLSNKIEPPAGIKPNWLRCLTYDSKLQRVIVSGRNSMYEYAPKAGKWTVLIPNNKGSFAGLAWQANTNTLYAIGDERGGDERSLPYLYELNVGGAVVERTPLTGPVFPGLISIRGLDRAELIDLGGDLAALIYRENRDSDSERPGKPETFLYVIDPKTGKTKLAWKE